jgi:ribosome-binding factor A
LLFEYDHSLEAGNRIELLLRTIKDWSPPSSGFR